MKYRCPYCGEPAFPALERLGIPIGGFGKYAVFFPTCPHCKKISRRASTVGEWCFLSIMMSLLGAVTVPLFTWSLTTDSSFAAAAFVVSIVLLLGGYGGIHYFLFHFDKPAFEARQDPLFAVMVNGEKRLPIRMGEIYVCCLLDRNHVNGIPQVIGLVHHIQKKEGKKAITIRVIRCDDTVFPYEGERVRIITESRFDVEGTVAALTPKKEL